MISIARLSEARADYREVIGRSPVAEEPNAIGIIHKFVDMGQSNYIGYINDEAAFLYGVITPTLLSSSRAFIWMLTTDVIDKHKFEFIRTSEKVVENTLREFDMIIGETHVKDQRAFKWLRWLGAVYWGYERELVPFFITEQTFRDRRKKR